MKLRTLALTFTLALLAALPAAADKVLILDTTGNGSSQEAQAALALLPSGSTVDIVDAATLISLASSGGLTAYRVVILADPQCGHRPALPVIPGNWGTDITGNVVIVGTDNYFHASSGGDQLVQKSMAYILSNPKTGAFISLSCYYDYDIFPNPSAPPGTPVPLLDNAFASSAGNFTVHGLSVPVAGGTSTCFNNAHITATHPALTGLTDAILSNWGCSVHEVFDSWPADFVVLAIAKNSGSSYTAPDGTVGSPYILARGDIAVLSDISLSPATAVNQTGTTHTVTASVKPPVAGVTVTFKVITGPNVGLTGTATTDSSGKATFTWASSVIGTDFIEAQFTKGGKTQTSNIARKDWVHTPKSCMRILQNKVLCEVDSAGRPTGNYIWQFRVQNLSGTPAAHLFVSGLPSPVVAIPDHLVFSPAITAISPVQQIIFKNTTPGPLTFIVSLHDSKLARCCSMEVTLDLPKCECAQIVSEATPSCFAFPIWSVPPPYFYTFTMQNLSPILAEKVLVAAVSPSDLVTPIATSQLQVSKAVNTVPPTLPGGTIGPLKLSIGGPLAAGGQKVCLNISLNDKEIDDCCSITRCFTLPNCELVIDDHFHPLGGATVTRLGTGFRISGIGTTGEDGVRLDTAGAETVALSWRPLDVAGPLPNGAFIEMRAAPAGGQPSGKLRVTKTDGGKYQIATSIDGARTYKVEVYRDGELAGTRSGQAGINVVVIWPVAGGAEVAHLTQSDHGDTLAFTLDAGENVAWQLTDGSTLTGDRFRITAEQPLVHEGLKIDTFELRAANIPEIVVTATSVTVDCNDNGVADAEDIANGTSLDLNHNGILDECDGSANRADLNTGFDDVRGTLLPAGTLPGGADDDDWRIVSPGPERPAKIVIQPSAGWPTPLSNTQWIASNPDQGRSTPGVSRTIFQRCFCLGTNADAVTLDLSLLADDRAVVSLNGQELGAGGAFFAVPLTIHRTGAVGDGLFVAGSNCLTVEVIDSGAVVTGLTLAGTMSATGTSCASHHP